MTNPPDLQQLVVADLKHTVCVTRNFVREARRKAAYHIDSQGRRDGVLVEVLSWMDSELAALEETEQLSGFKEFVSWRSNFKETFDRIIRQFRVTHRVIQTRAGFSWAPWRTHPTFTGQNLKRAVEATEFLLSLYGELGAEALTKLGVVLGSDMPPRTVVGFSHCAAPEIDYAKGQERPSIFASLPFWYAVKHRHISTLAHETVLGTIHALPEAHHGLLYGWAWDISELLRRTLPTPLRREPAFVTSAVQLGAGFASKLLADIVAYRIAGPAFLYSLYFLATGVRGVDPKRVDWKELPLTTRFGVLLRLHEEDMSQIASSQGGAGCGRWTRALERITDGLRAREAQFQSAYPKADYPQRQFEEELTAMALRMVDDTRAAGFPWRTDRKRSRSHKRIPRDAWGDVVTVMSGLSEGKEWKSTYGAYELNEIWGSFFPMCEFNVQALPTFLWGLWHEFRAMQMQPKQHLPVGQFVQPLWQAVLRGYSPPGNHAPHEYLEVVLVRLAPGTSADEFRARLAAETGYLQEQGYFVADLLGAWDLVFIVRGYFALLRHDVPAFDRDVTYMSEPHTAVRLKRPLPPGDSRRANGEWYKCLLSAYKSGAGLLAMTQFLLRDETTLGEVIDLIHAEQPGSRSLKPVLILDSLGWEDLIVFWRLPVLPTADDETHFQGLFDLISDSSLRSKVRLSFTQTLLNATFRHPDDGELSEQPLETPFRAHVQVAITGIAGSAEQELLRREMEKILPQPHVTLAAGQPDMLLRVTVEDRKQLFDLRRTLGTLLKGTQHASALGPTHTSAVVSLLRDRDLPRPNPQEA
ncbi:hypothetical protein OAX78_00420 [Planctomycetota bacterium]|nr:hypothetical protein [Planctomycetota bacterium]